MVLEICYFESIDSTQKALIRDLKAKKVNTPIAYVTNRQLQGVGSRGNSWIGEEGNLFFSFALPLAQLPHDLPLASASIYFSYILKEILASFGSKVWVKWPNDFYIEAQKCGGCVTNIVADCVVCGIGLNTKKAPSSFAKLDIEIDDMLLLQSYFAKLKSKPLWKNIFSKYKIEFYKNNSFKVHIKRGLIDLSQAKLLEDGALEIEGERIYSIR